MSGMAESLIRRVQDLPPELFDQIRDEVLSYEPPAPNANGYHFVDVTKAFQLPSILQVDRTSRDALSNAYFSQKVFRFYSNELFQKLIESMCDKHFALAAGFQSFIPPHSPEHRRFLEAFKQQIDARAILCGRMMLGHFEPSLQAEEDRDHHEGEIQDVFVVWNEPGPGIFETVDQ
jgi:hypothetical protein